MLRTLSIYLSVGVISATMSLVASFLLTHTLSPSEYGMGMLFVSLIAMVSAVGSVGMDRVFFYKLYECFFSLTGLGGLVLNNDWRNCFYLANFFVITPPVV